MAVGVSVVIKGPFTCAWTRDTDSSSCLRALFVKTVPVLIEWWSVTACIVFRVSPKDSACRHFWRSPQIPYLTPLCVIHSFTIAQTTHSYVLGITHRPVFDGPSTVWASSAVADSIRVQFQGNSRVTALLTQLPCISHKLSAARTLAGITLSCAYCVFAESIVIRRVRMLPLDGTPQIVRYQDNVTKITKRTSSETLLRF
jgi:hypothetical protein